MTWGLKTLTDHQLTRLAGKLSMGQSSVAGPPELRELSPVDALRVLCKEQAIRRMYERPQCTSQWLDKTADILLQCLVPILAFSLAGISIWAFGADAAVFLDESFKSSLECGAVRDAVLGFFKRLDAIFPPVNA